MISRENQTRGRPRGGGDEQVVSATRAAIAAYLHEQFGVMAGGGEIEGQHLEDAEDSLHEFATSDGVAPVSQLNADEQLRCGHGRDGDVRVVRDRIGDRCPPALERDEDAGVGDQSLHGSLAGALPTSRLSSRNSPAHAGSGG